MTRCDGNKAVLFDIDGTLLKCFGAGKNALIRACMEVFGTVGKMQRIDFQGKTDPLILHESLSAMGFSEEEITSKTDRMKELYFSYLALYLKDSNPVILPGVRELLDRLSQIENVLVGILTGNFFRSAGIKLAHFNLSGYFSFGVYGDDAHLRNNMPSIAAERILETFGIAIDFKDMIIIGDTVYDIECAKISGALSLSVGTGWADRELLLSKEPDYFLEDLSDTERIIGIICGG